MWFTDSEIRTKALQKLVWKNNNKLESKIIELLYEFFESTEENEIQVIPQDIFNMLGRMFRNHYWTVNDIRKTSKKKHGNLNHKIILWHTSNTTLIIQEVFIKIIKLDAISQLKRFHSSKFDEMMN